MARTLNIRLRRPFRNLLGAALAAVAIAIAVPAGVASGQQGIDRSVIPVAPDAPQTYVVQPGDTLWDISSRFLTDPWYWPEIWHVNPQVANPHLIYPGDTLSLTWVDGRPRVSLASGGPVRLSPRVREHPLSEAINAIPYERIAAFMSRPAVLSEDQVKGAPYVAHGRDHRLASSVGNDVYVRRMKMDPADAANFLSELPRRVQLLQGVLTLHRRRRYVYSEVKSIFMEANEKIDIHEHVSAQVRKCTSA
jgi:hypothetical protein